MCTVVCRWAPDGPVSVEMLALRDELAGRPFDGPGRWWPEHPRAVGGRDRLAGGSWCVTDVDTATTAVVLNRPERRWADPDAPSRGVLPLTAVTHADWPNHLDLTGMASFNLVVAGPSSLRYWEYDGVELRGRELTPGVHMVTPVGLARSVDPRFVAGRARLPASGSAEATTRAATGRLRALRTPSTEQVWADWLAVLRERPAAGSPRGLIVRTEVEGGRYETVFGQFIAATPGWLRLDHLLSPADGVDRPWTVSLWD